MGILSSCLVCVVPYEPTVITINKKDGYRQRNVRQFLQSACTLFGYLRVTPVCHCLHPFCGWRHLATSRESKAHLASPGYAPWTIAVNVTWMERGFNAGQTHCSICTHLSSTSFPLIQPVILKVRHFSTFIFCTFWPPMGTLLGETR